jgi:predicted nucleotidyltransferase
MFKDMNSLVTPTLKTLTWLGRHYRDSFYVRELAQKLTISSGAASGQLRFLAESGLVTSEQKGRTLLYRADISHPLVREAKVFSTLSELTPFIADLKENVTRIILFGSCATGEDTEESDIDLFIETSDRPVLQKIITQYEEEIPRKISPIIVSAEEGGQLRTRDRPLYERIRAGKTLAGEPL